SPHPGLQAFTRIRFEFRVSRFAFGEIVYYCSDSKLETRNAKRHLKIGQTMPPVSHCHRNVGQIITEHGIQSTEMPAPNQLPPAPATSFCTEDKTSMAPAG